MLAPKLKKNTEKNIFISTNKKRLDVIIPSRNSDKQKIFLQNSINSIINQKTEQDIEIRVIICTDPNFNEVNLPSVKRLNIQLLQSIKPTQAHALNTGIKKTDADYVSFLEDDDYWHPNFIDT